MLSESLDGSHGRRIINLNRASTIAQPISGNNRLTQVFDDAVEKHATFNGSTYQAKHGVSRGLTGSKDGNLLDVNEKRGDLYSNPLNKISANTLQNV